MKRQVFDPKHIGEAIRRRRRKLRWTQKRLAQEAGLNPTTLSKYENGHAQVGKANLKKISEPLRCSPDQLLKEAWEISEEEAASPAELSEDRRTKNLSFTNGFPQAELETLYDEYALDKKRLYVKTCQLLFEALRKR